MASRVQSGTGSALQGLGRRIDSVGLVVPKAGDAGCVVGGGRIDCALVTAARVGLSYGISDPGGNAGALSHSIPRSNHRPRCCGRIRIRGRIVLRFGIAGRGLGVGDRERGSHKGTVAAASSDARRQRPERGEWKRLWIGFGFGFGKLVCERTGSAAQVLAEFVSIACQFFRTDHGGCCHARQAHAIGTEGTQAGHGNLPTQTAAGAIRYLLGRDLFVVFGRGCCCDGGQRTRQ
mmetsp:Transcript_29040/g.68261  ORF Transcript_29040/g.68261 Transcript_29040/m.68261 type:complete len:234 (+) Transcript_29040:565-1266(+)